MKALHMITFILLIIGGLNWLLVSFGWNLVTAIFGMGMAATVIYFLVGVSAIIVAATHAKDCRMCGSGGSMMSK